MSDQRRPYTGHYGRENRRPAEGEVVAYAWAAWEVTHVADAVSTAEEDEKLRAYTPGFRAGHGPYWVTLRRRHGPKSPQENDRGDTTLRVPAGSFYRWDKYRSGRVPLCSCCGDPWPCRANLAEEAAAAAAERADELGRRAEIGACFGCGEPITTRQRVIRYPDAENVRALLADALVFHERESCRPHVVEYERERARCLPDAPPVVDFRSGALLRWNDGTEVPIDPESYHAAVLRAIALDGVEPREDGRLPVSASDRGRRDMWRHTGGGKCACGQARTHVGGNRAVGLTWGCRACVAEWVAGGYQPARQRLRRSTRTW